MTMPGSDAAEADERRRGADRRRHSEETLPFADRRRGPRRRAELPRAPWPSLLLAGTLGVLSALAAQGTLAATTAGERALRPVPASILALAPDPEAAQACLRAGELRDRADALTPAGMFADERTVEAWLETAEAVEHRLSRGVGVGRCERDALRATHAALVRVGVLRPRT